MEDKSNRKIPFIFSNIFESEEDCKNNPFVFEKFGLKTNVDPKDYKDSLFEGLLFIMKKTNESNAAET